MMSQKLAVVTLAMVAVIAQPLYAQATSHPYSQTTEWKGITNVLSVMGKGRLTPADKTSLFEILDTKSEVEESKPNLPSAYPATPILPTTTQKLPPHRTPRSF
ncbi:MAG TPA: hypothetical protein VN132_03500 [Bdellovibrio sp.]|nr:hypothetical protein [Bdellovibrio sp.]